MPKRTKVLIYVIAILCAGYITSFATEQIRWDQMIIDAPYCEVDSSVGCEKTHYQKGGANMGFPVVNKNSLLVDGDWIPVIGNTYAFGLSGRQINTAVYSTAYAVIALALLGARKVAKRK